MPIGMASISASMPTSRAAAQASSIERLDPMPRIVDITLPETTSLDCITTPICERTSVGSRLSSGRSS